MVPGYQRLVPSTLVACATLLVYDHLCTLDQEVAHVWSNPLSGGSILFMLNRYLPYVDTFMSLNLQVLSLNDPQSCLKQNTVLTWFIVFGIILSETILILRTVALWGRRRIIIIILCCSSGLTFIPAIVITELEIRSLEYIPSLLPHLPGCRLGRASPIIIFSYILLALSETTVGILTAIQAYRSLRFSHSPWVKQMYKDGLLYYVYVLALSIANVLVAALAPRYLANWLASPQRVIHSVLCNRVLLQILRQRTGTLTNRLPVVSPDQDQRRPIPMFTSFIENEEMDTNITIACMLHHIRRRNPGYPCRRNVVLKTFASNQRF
ncbi:hypothetical protein Agabi119p4_10257 [Agaricus bisporus var. burnettii]|uniref:DUF6533 domain-containing protein n=1 Tax=Agaricus bisporus var. burnettii TaxID=192524 RepID=A0A8H7C2I8_AGABI|nr:hypothetical protein Agabi119p4_10257 [Agaricus bisporus var. burnettii]